MAWYQLHAGGTPDSKFVAGLVFFITLSLALAWSMTRAIDEPLVNFLWRWRRRTRGSEPLPTPATPRRAEF
jgi:peptidoglycan/LPS O-acetylase OafA/YrhL